MVVQNGVKDIEGIEEKEIGDGPNRNPRFEETIGTQRARDSATSPAPVSTASRKAEKKAARVAAAAWAVLPNSRESSRIQSTCRTSPVKPDREKRPKIAAVRKLECRLMLLICNVLRFSLERYNVIKLFLPHGKRKPCHRQILWCPCPHLLTTRKGDKKRTPISNERGSERLLFIRRLR